MIFTYCLFFKLNLFFLIFSYSNRCLSLISFFFYFLRPNYPRCLLKNLVVRVFFKLLAYILELKIYLIPSFLSSNNLWIWWYIISICFVQFYLFPLFLNIKLSLLSPNILIFLILLFCRSLFTSCQIYTPSLISGLTTINSTFKVDV